MVFRHVLAGARVRALREVKGGVVVVVETPARSSAFETPTLDIELRGADAAAVGDVADMTVGQEAFTFVRRVNGADETASLADDVTLGPLRTAAGKAISMMKIASVARKVMQSTGATAVPSIDTLHAVRDRAVSAAERLLLEAGFRGRSPFWLRDGDDRTQAVELVSSRFNTALATSFHFRAYLLLGTTKKTPRNFRGLVGLVRGPVPGAAPGPALFGPLLAPLLGVDAAKVEEATVAHMREVLLPWLDAHRNA